MPSSSRVIALLLSLLLCSCGGASVNGTAPERAPLPPSAGGTPPGQMLLPSLAEVAAAYDARRQGSFTMAEGHRNGAEFDAGLYNTNVVADGDTAVFTPSFVPPDDQLLANASIALFSFVLPGYAGGSVRFSVNWLDRPPDGELFWAISDWDNDVWRWIVPPASDSIVLPDLSPYIRDDDVCFVAVAAIGSGEYVLDELQFETQLPPQADLLVDVDSGPPPLTVNFDASGSTDPDGVIVDYEWDLDGDGVYNEPLTSEEDARGQFSATHTYLTEGSINVRVRVTDDDGGQDIAQREINVATGQPPTALLTAVPLSGDKPLSVDFDASGSSDPDGTIVDFEWDFDGDGTYSEPGTGEESAHGVQDPTFVYETAGVFDAVVRVTDDGGNADTDVQQITVTNSPPVADLQADVTEGDAPLAVSFDASASADPGGTIVDLEWDFDGDGVYNEDDNGEQANRNLATPPPYTYTEAGFRSPSVRITDDDGASDIASIDIMVHGWVVVTVDSADESGLYPSLALINFRPAIAYQRNNPTGGLRYAVSSTVTGAADADWTVVDAATGMAGNPVGISLAQVSGAPAITYKDPSDTSLRYARSSTPSGSNAESWSGGTNLLLDSTGDEGEYTSLVIVGGNPAVCYSGAASEGAANFSLKFLRASTSDGAFSGDWTTPTIVDDPNPLNCGFFCHMAVVGGNPAISYQYTSNGELHYARAMDANGLLWAPGNQFNVDTSGKTYSGYGALAIVDGNPAILARRNDDVELRFLRASTATGETQVSWTGGTNVTPETTLLVGENASMAFSGGFPVVAFSDTTDYDLHFGQANLSSGSTQASWDDGEHLTLDGPANVGGGIAMIDNAGQPAIAYTDLAGMDLKFAARI